MLIPCFLRRYPVWVGMLSALLLTGCGGDETPTATDGDSAVTTDGNPDKQNDPPPIDPATIPLPEVKTGVCRVYTPQPGFQVLVDGELVRNEVDGEWLTTPCEVTLPVGNHDIKVVKKGYRDTPLPGRVSVTADTPAEAVLEPVEDPLNVADSVLAAPYLLAKVGEPIPLESLNSPNLETDPFVTADGLAIYFASDRSEGNGIYYATRSSPYVEFYPPQLLQTSRGSDDKATPSITGDARIVTFAMPHKQRIKALLRDSPLGDFIETDNLKYSTSTDEIWRSSQMLSDGLRMYWTVEKKGALETHVASRASRDGNFGDVLIVDMPGGHPCISSDGLRQYVFDGKTLSRARRNRTSAKFSKLETIATVALEDYVPSKLRRQYFVSDDEQWLYYCNNPNKQGNLFMVRLSQGAGWGFAAFGKNIPPRKVVAANPPETQPDPVTQPETGPQVDPQTLPLPYTTYWQQFTKLMQTRDYAAAKQLIEKSQADRKFAQDEELLQWDLEDVNRATGFWNDVRSTLQQLKAGDTIRFGSAKVALVKFEKGEITAKARTKEIVKAIAEMRPADLLGIADLAIDKEDAAGQARMGVFLHYEPEGGVGSAEARFERAGDAGAEFYERQGKRILHQARQEFERDKIAEGLKFIAKVNSEFPKTQAAADAKQLEVEAYQFTKWQQRGRWEKGKEGEFIAGSGRVADSYLMSPAMHDNFELRLEWKTAANGSGGVFFRYRGRGDPNLFGYKIQLADDFGSGRVDPQTTGALFNDSAPTRNAVKKRGEWNTLRMQVRGTQVTVEINGREVLQTDAEVSNFKQAQGYVMLDGVAGGMTYRKTLLVKLPPAK